MADMHMPLTLADLEYDCSGAQRDFFLQTIAADANIHACGHVPPACRSGGGALSAAPSLSHGKRAAIRAARSFSHVAAARCRSRAGPSRSPDVSGKGADEDHCDQGPSPGSPGPAGSRGGDGHRHRHHGAVEEHLPR